MPAPGAAGVGDGSEGKVRAGAGWRGGGTGAKEHPVPAAGCAPGEEVVRGGGAGGREARGGERSGLRPPHRALLLWGRRSQCFRRVSPRPHASAGVTSYREAPESGSRAGVSASWGRDGLGECGVHVRARAAPPAFRLSKFLAFYRGGARTYGLTLFAESHNRRSLIQSDSTSCRCL